MIYKLKFLALVDDDSLWFDLYFDVTKITGFYIPVKDDPNDEDSINIFFEGDCITVQAEEHIKDYLGDKFVEGRVE